MPGRTDPFWISLAVALISSTAAFTDLRSRRIPNLLTFGATLAAVLFHILLQGGAGALECLGGAVGGLLLYVPLFIPGWVGAGDAKLLMAFGAWGGFRYAANVAALAIAAGAALAVVQLGWRGTLPDFLRRFWSFLRSWSLSGLAPMAFKADRRATLPFAIPMAIAAIGRSLEILPEVVPWFR